jgi:hypothetical protein
MGKGTDAARVISPEHAALIDAMKEQLLIVFLKRLGGDITVPVAEVDDTGQDLFAFSVRDGVFHFKLMRKS